MQYTLLFVFVLFYSIALCQPKTIQQWHTITLNFKGPHVTESDADNPFLNYKLDVYFTNGKSMYKIPGYYAADGNAAETSADKGNIWQVRFTPNKTGLWKYYVSFKKGHNIAVNDADAAGIPVAFNGTKGSFMVTPSTAPKNSFMHKGMLKHTGKRYLQFTGNGEYFLKGGANSPENFLAFADIDGTYSYDTAKTFLKTWQPHIKDWQPGNPTWQQGKGKGIIGALNYLAQKGMNSIYFLTMNIGGDARDVWPYTNHKTFDRFDVSKLAQWNMVLTHAQNLGIVLHVVTQEKENELLLDSGNVGIQRKLYYRELFARLGHFNALVWNLGEENGRTHWWPTGQTPEQQLAMIEYVKTHDPYNHPMVVHTLPTQDERENITAPFVNNNFLDGISLQEHQKTGVHTWVTHWVKRTDTAKKKWNICMDEIGMWYNGTQSDQTDPQHDTCRKHVLWGALMGGAGGVEWYFGWTDPPNDLNAEDWRSRNNMWEQTNIALTFFKAHVPFYNMQPADELLYTNHTTAPMYCFAEKGSTYVIFQHEVTKDVYVNLSDLKKTSVVYWYNTRTGGKLEGGTVYKVTRGNKVNIGMPTNDLGKDWVAIITAKYKH
jgi:hypothetical protein